MAEHCIEVLVVKDSMDLADLIRLMLEEYRGDLENLLSNTVNYSPGGGDIVVHVADLGHEVKVAGLGIDTKHLPRVFEQFSRVSDTAHSIAGRGLYITKAVVEAHGGRVWAVSEGPGKVVRSPSFFRAPQPRNAPQLSP